MSVSGWGGWGGGVSVSGWDGCSRCLYGACVSVCLQVLLELLVNQTIFRRESVAELCNGTLTAKSIEDLDLGWTEGQAKELLDLADKMTDLRFSGRPTAKEVRHIVI